MKTSSAQVPAQKTETGPAFSDDAAVAVRIVEALGDISQSTVFEIGSRRRSINVNAGAARPPGDRHRNRPRAGRAA